MKVVLAGAFGKLGSDILRSLVRDGHEVIAVDLSLRDITDIKGNVTASCTDFTHILSSFK